MGEENNNPGVSRHGKIWIIITTVVVTVAVMAGIAGAAYYYYYLPQQQNQAEDSQQTDQDDQEETDQPADNNADTSDQQADETADTTDPTANWLTYTNSKYGYSFKYPPNYIITSNCKNISCVSEQHQGDYTILQGDISQKGWPMISVSHYSTSQYNPPAGTNLLQWLPVNFSTTTSYLPTVVNYTFTLSNNSTLQGVDLTIPQSPQAYSQREIYYIYQNKLFKITMLDVASAGGANFYQNWLPTYLIN